MVLFEEQRHRPLIRVHRAPYQRGIGGVGVGPINKEKRRFQDHLTAIGILKGSGLKGIGVIGAYHVRRVEPLMVCALPLFEIMPSTSLKGTVLAHDLLYNSEIA
jgi:hypothetical protein